METMVATWFARTKKHPDLRNEAFRQWGKAWRKVLARGWHGVTAALGSAAGVPQGLGLGL